MSASGLADRSGHERQANRQLSIVDAVDAVHRRRHAGERRRLGAAGRHHVLVGRGQGQAIGSPDGAIEDRQFVVGARDRSVSPRTKSRSGASGRRRLALS